ncbi:DNA polymerase III subunit delta' [Clostridium perfringens]|uniref:DNA polymerase III subunit delta' n=1 Tax=Clostridium perfringens TaxID=1502 RepID=UPI00103B4536|nr:DNA polymerase III subunit delta' [Clostridium perfringens]ELC8434807.1 DNA polymerase III subunit delta' [Clostridium perfringens]MDK0840992.1 DNA polymerase III subunit delta' [Clostridium perfringens]MDK0904543.1 DNA polymerase III subunit delta' [Clostridium perfringens]MDM0938120.1 DNA polymerase III subunit delta' [Clostridium perfringens]MDU6313518.1 DNA polymerase III subunit delta' [Clostridium perfringens]
MIGHNKVRDRFSKSVSKNALSHAHLIIGEDGIGKSLLADEFAYKILGIPSQREHVDIVHYKSEKTSFGVDLVRNIIAEANKKPYECDRKVIIIHNGEKLTVAAQNALLKTIEEPLTGIFIIILSSNIDSILETIRSRCQIHRLAPLSKEEINLYISKKYNGIDDELNRTLISFSEGIPGRVDKFMNDDIFKDIRNTVIEMLKDIGHGKIEVPIKYSDKFYSMKGNEEEILETITIFARDSIIFKEIENNLSIINGDKIDDIREIASNLSYNKLNRIIKVVNEARNNLKSNTNLWLTLDSMLISILEE